MTEIGFLIAGIIILFILLILTVIALLYVSGILQPVDVGAGTPPIPRVTVAYKFSKGSYGNAGNLYNEVTRLAPKSKAIGIYYDNPNMVAASGLRYAIGAVLSEGDIKVEPDVQKEMESAGFKIIILPEVTNCVRAKFPYINTLSILIAVKKVYPHIDSYIQEHRLCAYPMVEIYESDYIHFMAPLARQDEFFVPEAKESVSAEYREESLLRESSLLDTPGGTPTTFYDDSSYYDHSPERGSRDMSEFSHTSAHTLGSPREDTDIETDQTDIQDTQITSSADVTSSGDATTSDSATLPDLSQPSRDQSLQDSGICSGQPSAMDSSLVKDAPDGQNSDENDSSSSFEEIHMEEGQNVKT